MEDIDRKIAPHGVLPGEEGTVPYHLQKELVLEEEREKNIPPEVVRQIKDEAAEKARKKIDEDLEEGQKMYMDWMEEASNL